MVQRSRRTPIRGRLFDDERVVANAGVMLPALLAGRIGIGGAGRGDGLILAAGWGRRTRAARS